MIYSQIILRIIFWFLFSSVWISWGCFGREVRIRWLASRWFASTLPADWRGAHSALQSVFPYKIASPPAFMGITMHAFSWALSKSFDIGFHFPYWHFTLSPNSLKPAYTSNTFLSYRRAHRADYSNDCLWWFQSAALYFLCTYRWSLRFNFLFPQLRFTSFQSIAEESLENYRPQTFFTLFRHSVNHYLIIMLDPFIYQSIFLVLIKF
jgi:hypothetical protein